MNIDKKSDILQYRNAKYEKDISNERKNRLVEHCFSMMFRGVLLKKGEEKFE